MYGPNLRQFPVTYGQIQSSREQTSPGTIGGTEGTLPTIRAIREVVPLSTIMPVRMQNDLNPWRMPSMQMDYASFPNVFTVGIDATSTFTPSLARVSSFVRALAASSTFTPVVTRSIAYIRALAATSVFAPVISRLIARVRTLAATSTFTTTITRAIGRMMAVSSTFTPSVITTRALVRALDATTTMTATLARIRGYVRTLAVQYGRASSATYLDASGVEHTAGVDVLRSAHYMNGVLQPPLIEGAATNANRWARDFTNPAWTMGGVGSAVQNAIGLDGSANSATTLTDSDATQRTNWLQNTTIPNDSATHCQSFWIKKDTDQSRMVGCRLLLSGGTAVQRTVNLNTQTGANSTNGIVGTGTSRVIDAGLWWIVEITMTNNSTGNTIAQSRLLCAAQTVLGTDNVATTGSCAVGHAQLELNATAYTSPIFTTTAAASRAADIGYYAPAISRGFGRIVPVASTFTAALAKQFSYGRSLAATSTFTPALSRLIGRARTLAATTTITPALSRSLGRILAVSAPFTANLRRDLARQMAVASTFSPAVVKNAARARLLAATSSFAPGLSRITVRRITLAVSSTFAALLEILRSKPLQIIQVFFDYLGSRFRVSSKSGSRVTIDSESAARIDVNAQHSAKLDADSQSASRRTLERES